MSALPESPLPLTTTRRSFIHRIVALALAQPAVVIAATIMVAAAGIWAFSRLPIDAYPDLSAPTVEITTQWPGHAAEEVSPSHRGLLEGISRGPAGYRPARRLR